MKKILIALLIIGLLGLSTIKNVDSSIYIIENRNNSSGTGEGGTPQQNWVFDITSLPNWYEEEVDYNVSTAPGEFYEVDLR